MTFPEMGHGICHSPNGPLSLRRHDFVTLSRRTNNYFLTSIDAEARWEEQQGLKAYLASGQSPGDKAKAEALKEELKSLRQEMSKILAGLDPNISDDGYFAVMGPMEKREPELRAEYFEVLSRRHISLMMLIISRILMLAREMRHSSPLGNRDH